jgi:hypothetical protein
MKKVNSAHKLNYRNILYYRHSNIHRHLSNIDCLSFVMLLATSVGLNSLLFFSFLLQPLTVLMKQTRQAVRANSSLYFLDVYGNIKGSAGPFLPG